MYTYLMPSRSTPRLQQSNAPPDASACGVALWQAAMRWRHAVEDALEPVALTLTRWWILAAADMLATEAGEAISQNAIARWARVDRATTSQVIRKLEAEGLIDRSPEFGGPAFRVLVTPKGRRVLRSATPLVETASRRGLAGISSLKRLHPELESIAPDASPERG